MREKTGITAPKGFLANGIYCGLRKNRSKLDLAMIYSEKRASAAAVFTQNKVKGAPILLCQKNLADPYARAVIVNSGNANTCNADGLQKAETMASLTADCLDIDETEVLVASTGVIGQPLNIDVIVKSALPLAQSLTESEEGAKNAATAIMTTDTVPKMNARTFILSGKKVTIGGMCKGSGMININMATMLGFLTTDAAVSPPMLQKALNLAAAETFNQVSIDGDTSTNDTLILLANGMAENKMIEEEDGDFKIFLHELILICEDLSKKLAKDGEGATKLLECHVSGAPSGEIAKKLSKTVIQSDLVKSAFFGADANWGRILCALGYSGTPLAVDKVDVFLSSRTGEFMVCENGAGVNFSEELAKKVLLEDEILIDVHLNDGDASAKAYGCDLTYDYVKINGDYRT